ncbi:Phage integrase family protein [compost metagenome]
MSAPISTRYLLRKPNKKRRGFRIYLQTKNADGKTENQTVVDPDIIAINHHLKDGTYSEAQGHLHAERVRARLNAAIGVLEWHERPENQIANKENEELLERYWKAEYEHRMLADEATARYKLQRACRALGNLSIISGSREDLAGKVKSLTFDNRKKREITGKLNQLLRFAKREFKLQLPRKTRVKVKYLTLEEYAKVEPFLKTGAKALSNVAIKTGARQGEAYASDPNKCTEKSIYIDTQLTRGEEKDPKWNSVRPAYGFPGFLEDVKTVATLRQAGQLPTRWELYREFTSACVKAFPDNKGKHCTYHDLRHSYAIALLTKGVPLKLVSESMGNTQSVCEEYYAGFVLTKEGLDMIDTIVNPTKT